MCDTFVSDNVYCNVINFFFNFSTTLYMNFSMEVNLYNCVYTNHLFMKWQILKLQLITRIHTTILKVIRIELSCLLSSNKIYSGVLNGVQYAVLSTWVWRHTDSAGYDLLISFGKQSFIPTTFARLAVKITFHCCFCNKVNITTSLMKF